MAKSKKSKRRSSKKDRKSKIKKLVKSVVKSAMNSQAETKKNVFTMSHGAFSKEEFVTYNVFYYMTQGDTASRFQGNEIHLKGLKIEGILQATANATNLESRHFQILVFALDDYFTITNVPKSALTDNNLYTRIVPDNQKVKIYAQKCITLDWDSTANPVKKISMYVPFSKKIVYQDYGTDYKLKSNNIYVGLFATTFTGTPIVNGAGLTFVGQVNTYFKDF